MLCYAMLSVSSPPLPHTLTPDQPPTMTIVSLQPIHLPFSFGIVYAPIMAKNGNHLRLACFAERRVPSAGTSSLVLFVMIVTLPASPASITTLAISVPFVAVGAESSDVAGAPVLVSLDVSSSSPVAISNAPADSVGLSVAAGEVGSAGSGTTVRVAIPVASEVVGDGSVGRPSSSPGSVQ